MPDGLTLDPLTGDLLTGDLLSQARKEVEEEGKWQGAAPRETWFLLLFLHVLHGREEAPYKEGPHYKKT